MISSILSEKNLLHSEIQDIYNQKTPLLYRFHLKSGFNEVVFRWTYLEGIHWSLIDASALSAVFTYISFGQLFSKPSSLGYHKDSFKK